MNKNPLGNEIIGGLGSKKVRRNQKIEGSKNVKSPGSFVASVVRYQLISAPSDISGIGCAQHPTTTGSKLL